MLSRDDVNSAWAKWKTTAIESENRIGTMYKDSSAFGGEINLYTDGDNNTRVAAFGINGSLIPSNLQVVDGLQVNGQLSLFGPSTTGERQAVYTNDPQNSARAPPSLCQKFIKISHYGQDYALALYNMN